MRLNPRQRAAHALFKTYMDIVHVDKEEGDKLFKQRTGAEVRYCVGCLCALFVAGMSAHVKPHSMQPSSLEQVSLQHTHAVLWVGQVAASMHAVLSRMHQA